MSEGWKASAERYFKNQSDIKIAIVSFMISGYFAYKYLKGKHVMMEYNGHFNSPQSLMNRKLSGHYLKDAAARFCLGLLILSASQVGLKYYLDGYQVGGNENIDDDLEEEYINTSIESEDINESIKRRENVNKYLKK
jgi:hypothetical protein